MMMMMIIIRMVVVLRWHQETKTVKIAADYPRRNIPLETLLMLLLLLIPIIINLSRRCCSGKDGPPRRRVCESPHETGQDNGKAEHARSPVSGEQIHEHGVIPQIVSGSHGTATVRVAAAKCQTVLLLLLLLL